MLSGFVDARNTPLVILEIGGREWEAIVDSGFNGYFELPSRGASAVEPQFRGSGISLLAGDQVVEEDYYAALVPFDGEIMDVLVTFVQGDRVLVGTRAMRSHRLEIDFPRLTVSLVRV